MTLGELIWALLRRWPVVLVGGTITAMLGLFAISDHGVYWTRTQVIFLAPSSAVYPNALQTTSEDLIITAGIVAKRVVGPAQVVKYASPDATIIGATGVREGYWIRLPDTGGQWAPNFATQTLYIEVVGPSYEYVDQTQARLVDEIASQLDDLQNGFEVPPESRIATTVAPESTLIYQVKGSRPRALAMVAALGIAATLAVVFILEHRYRRRRDEEAYAEAAAEYEDEDLEWDEEPAEEFEPAQ